jgi:hypothetical protein
MILAKVKKYIFKTLKIKNHSGIKMGVNGLMQFLRKKIPHVFHSKQHHRITGTAYVDTPLITMSCGMVAQASHATIDPYALVKQKLIAIEYLLRERGAQDVKFVFDGPTRKEKVQTCMKRAETIKKQSEKRKRDSLQIYRVESPKEESMDIKESEEIEMDAFWPSSLTSSLARDSEFPMSPAKQEFSIFPDVTQDHCLESDLYISSMIVHGTDTYVLKDLARFARISLGDRAIIAPHDSESFIAAMVKPGDVGVTCDSDALPFGCEWIVQNIGTAKEIWIKLSDVLQGLDMTLQEFRIFCVLLGTDFNSRLYLCGPTKCFPVIATKSFRGFEHFCSLHGKSYSIQEKKDWIKSAEESLLVFSSEKIS